MENTEKLENTIILKGGYEISKKVSVLSWDKINLLYKKFAREEIGDFQLTLEVIKLLLVDKTKIKEIDEILNGDLSETFIENLTDWGEKILEIITGFIDSKKK